MPVRPAAEKLPLALRKNLRDAYESKKPELEKQLSDLLGTAWTVDVNPNEIWPYADSSYAKESLGDCITTYIEGAIWRIEYFLSSYGDLGKDELNSVCFKHVLTIAYDEEGKVSYCGVDVKDGQLRILFAENDLGTNASYALSELHTALSEAPAPPDSSNTLSFLARASVRADWDPKVEELKTKIKDQLKFEMKLNPNLEDIYKKLKATEKSAGLSEGWDKYIGSTVFDYFTSFLSVLEYNKFAEDDLLREGVEEGATKKEVALRVVDKLQGGSYNEVVLEDGVIFLQTTPESWGTNVGDTASKLVDLF